MTIERQLTEVDEEAMSTKYTCIESQIAVTGAGPFLKNRRGSASVADTCQDDPIDLDPCSHLPVAETPFAPGVKVEAMFPSIYPIFRVGVFDGFRVQGLSFILCDPFDRIEHLAGGQAKELLDTYIADKCPLTDLDVPEVTHFVDRKLPA